MANSPEYLTITQCGPELTDAIKHDLDTLSVELNAAGLISSDNADESRNHNVGAALRAATLVGVVRDRVKLDTSNYSVFVKVLQKREMDHKSILKILDEKYLSLGEFVCACQLVVSPRVLP